MTGLGEYTGGRGTGPDRLRYIVGPPGIQGPPGPQGFQGPPGPVGFAVVAVDYEDWPPVDPQPNTLYLRKAQV